MPFTLKNPDADVRIRAVFEVELVLARFLRRASRHETAGFRVAESSGAELLVDKNACLGFGYTVGNCRLEPVINDLLNSCDLGGLFGRQSAAPVEHLRLKRRTMVKRQYVKRLIKSDFPDGNPFPFRYRRIRGCDQPGDARSPSRGHPR